MRTAFAAPLKRQAWAGAVLLATLLSGPIRSTLEASMSTHMLIQFPLLLLAGALLGQAVPASLDARLQEWNAHGMAGLAWVALVLALTMVPRLLDLALIDPHLEALKVAALVTSGAALRASWNQAGTVLQGFFLGNALPMMAIAGWLYETSPVRVCNAYRLDEQQQLGQALGWLAGALAFAWLGRLMWRLRQASAGDGDCSKSLALLQPRGLQHD